MDDSPLQQSEIEALMAGAGGSSAPQSPAADAPLGQDEIEALLAGGKPAGANAGQSASPAHANAAPGGRGNSSQPTAGPGNSGAAHGSQNPASPPSRAGAASPATKTGTATATAANARPSQARSSGSGPGRGSAPPPVNLGSDINVLLEQAERAISSIDDPSPNAVGAKPFQLADFSGSTPTGERTSLDLLRDVELELKIELGRTRMQLDEMMKLKSGSVVSLDKLAGDPVDIFVNGRMIAKGEVLVFNDNFCVRVAELISGDDV